MTDTPLLASSRALVEEVWCNSDKWVANLAKAEGLLRGALDANPNEPLTLTCLGAVLCDQGRHSSAVSPLKLAVERGSTDRHTFFNLGVALLSCGRHDEASSYFEQARDMAASPLSWEAYFDAQAH